MIFIYDIVIMGYNIIKIKTTKLKQLVILLKISN